MAEIDPLLARQLRRLGLEDLSEPPDKETWHKVLARISDHYRHVTDDRNLLTRSLDLSTNEMGALHHQLLEERDRLRGVVEAISDALTIFHDAAHSPPEPTNTLDVTYTVTSAKRRFTTRLGEILAVSDVMASDARSSSARTARRTSSSPDAQPSSMDPAASGSGGAKDVIDDIRVQLLGLADRLVQLLYDTAEKASLKKQLEVARAVQQMLVPAEDVIQRQSLRLASHFQPAAECGGDWWTFHDLPEGRLLTVVGDVTGHGISSAIITGAAKAACDLARTFSGDQLTAPQLLRLMNCSIYEAGKQRLMMTCVACVFDPASSTMTVANAGHPFPYLVRESSLKQLATQGAPLGAASATEYQAATIPVQPGDAILWFTDGVTECENEAREQFTDRRLRALFQAAAPAPPEVARDAIVSAVEEFRGSRAMGDDMTLVVGRVQ